MNLRVRVSHVELVSPRYNGDEFTGTVVQFVPYSSFVMAIVIRDDTRKYVAVPIERLSELQEPTTVARTSESKTINNQSEQKK